MIATLARAFLAVLLLLPATALADDREALLISQIRMLTLKFDNIANRDSSAPMDLAQSREQFGNYLRDAASLGMLSPVLREHAEIFVLSGGDISVLKPWEEGLKPGTPEKKLFDGIMAYGRGSTAEAEALLLSLDALTLDPMRGGHLALAQALLASRLSPERAFGYFDMARLLLPGTLVEEAALRQIVVLAVRTSNKERFLSAANSYLSRFRRSAYVPGFEVQLAAHIVRFPGRDGYSILQELLAAHPQGWGRCLACFVATIAEQSVILGKVDLAIAAARSAMPLVSDGTFEKQRLLLYYGAALIVTDDFAHGVEALKSVDQGGFDQKDRELLNASLQLAAKLRETPVQLNPDQLSVLASETPKHDRAFVTSNREKEARAALANADEILKQAK